MKKYISLFLIILSIFLLIKSYIILKSEIPISSAGGGGGVSAFFDK